MSRSWVYDSTNINICQYTLLIGEKENKTNKIFMRPSCAVRIMSAGYERGLSRRFGSLVSLSLSLI